jgi:hypothetical protein
MGASGPEPDQPTLERILFLAPPGTEGHPKIMTAGSGGWTGKRNLISNATCYWGEDGDEGTSIAIKRDHMGFSAWRSVLQAASHVKGEPWDPHDPDTGMRHAFTWPLGDWTLNLHHDPVARMGITVVSSHWQSFELFLIIPGRLPGGPDPFEPGGPEPFMPRLYKYEYEAKIIEPPKFGSTPEERIEAYHERLRAGEGEVG